LHPHPYFSKVAAFPLEPLENVRQTLTDNRRDCSRARGECQRFKGGFRDVHAVGKSAGKVAANGGREFGLGQRACMPRREGGVGGQNTGERLQGMRFGHGLTGRVPNKYAG